MRVFNPNVGLPWMAHWHWAVSGLQVSSLNGSAFGLLSVSFVFDNWPPFWISLLHIPILETLVQV